MGGLIPNPHDDSVKDKLDKQFSNPKLRNLRKRINRGSEPHFFSDPANARHLARISHRLKVWPEPDRGSGEPPPTTAQLKARWQYLLQVSLTDPAKAGQGGSTVAELIRNALQVFVVTDDPSTVPAPPNKCTAITFEAIKAALPGALEYHVNITPSLTARPVGNYAAKIQLVCRQEIAQGVGSNDPPADNGEVPPVQPDFQTRRRPKPKPKPKKPPKKHSAKKSAKKKKKSAKKVSKKAAKKTAKKARKRAHKR
jgi:outer membrane biosynthesis protein TonB